MTRRPHAFPRHTVTNWTESTLRQRGWTSELISALLGEPDELSENYGNTTAPMLRRYKPERVRAAELTASFIENRGPTKSMPPKTPAR